MKLSSRTTVLSVLWTASALLSTATTADGARGSAGAGRPDFLQGLQQHNRVRKLKSGDDSGDGAGGTGDPSNPLSADQCYICTKEVDGVTQQVGDRPDVLTVRFFGGVGNFSNFQPKATCTNQDFPVNGTFTIGDGVTYDGIEGKIITIGTPGTEMAANTEFIFSNGVSCTIHTSCSQPLVGGDRIGPFLLLEGNDCIYEYCGDGTLNGNETCEPGDGSIPDCRDDCTYCGDGRVDEGEECDLGADNGILESGGCKEDCTTCICEASATYDSDSGAVTIEFDMCGAEPLKSDFIGIYPCDAETGVADRAWWDSTVCRQFPAACGEFKFGYVENLTYVNQTYEWFSYTCGSPQDGGCQTTIGPTEWPSSGKVVIDPNQPGANFAYTGGQRTLEPGCYKAILQREMYFISPPPYPDICAPWGEALTFQVPAPNLTTSTNPLEVTSASPQISDVSTIILSLVSFVSLYLLVH